MTTAITVIATVPVGSYPWGWRGQPQRQRLRQW